MNQFELSILIATKNEEASITHCLDRVTTLAPDKTEILVIDGGNDRTEEQVLQFNSSKAEVRYIRNHGDRGKGHAIRVGIAHARAEIHLQLDADLQFPPESLPALVVPILKDEADITLGSRFMTGSVRKPGSTPRIRTVGNQMISLWSSILTGQRMTDVMAGAKAWKRSAIETIDLSSDGYSYELEIAVKGVLCGLRVLDVPVLTAARHDGSSKVHVMSVGPRLFRDAVSFRQSCNFQNGHRR